MYKYIINLTKGRKRRRNKSNDTRSHTSWWTPKLVCLHVFNTHAHHTAHTYVSTASLTLFLNYIFQMAINVGRESRRKKFCLHAIGWYVPFFNITLFVCIGIWNCVLCAYDSQQLTFTFVHHVNCYRTKSNCCSSPFFAFCPTSCVVWVMFDRKVEVHKHDQRLNRKNRPCVACCLFRCFFICTPFSLDQTNERKNRARKSLKLFLVCASAAAFFPFVQFFVRFFPNSTIFSFYF